MAFSKEKAHDRAEKYAAKGQHDRAAREYQAIVEHDPKDVRAWLMLADSLARTGDRAGAVSRYQQVGDFYTSQREHQKALAVYRQVLNLDPTRLDIHYKCANLNLEVGRVHDAIASFESIAQAQISGGRVREALDTYRTIADADPSVVSKRLRLAELYSRERMVEEAVEAFRQAGEMLLQGSRHADYVRVAERLIYHKPDDRETIRSLARVYLHLGDARRALLKLNGLLQTDPEDAGGLELLAETFMALGKPDKASSVMVELIRSLRSVGDDSAAQRALETGLDWIPGQPELLKLQGDVPRRPPSQQNTEPVPHVSAANATAPAEDAGVDAGPLELDVDDSDVVELDDTDFELTDSDVEELPVAAPEPIAPSPSMTEHVLSEVDEGPVAPDGLTDFDKVLFEARVYVKYRLFEHALEHVQMLLETQPDHVGALSLQARSLTELERVHEAADAHVQVAKLVLSSDPRLAAEHLGAALEAAPDHAEALSLQAAAVADTTDGSGGIPLDDAPGDSGAFDLLDEDDDIAIDVADPEPDPEPPSRPLVVENRFGISEAGPLPESGNPGGSLELAPTEQMEALRRAREERTESTPPAGFVARPPAEPPGVPLSADPHRTFVDLDADNDEPTGQIDIAERTSVGMDTVLDLDSGLLELEDDPDTAEHELPAGADRGNADADPGPSDRDVLAALSDELDDEPDAPSQPAASSRAAAEPEGPRLDVHAELADFDEAGAEALELQDQDRDPAATVSPALQASSGPAASLAPPGGWPDLSEDLAEIRFFVDQGLDEDAQAGLEDLARQNPGHPGVEALRADLNGAQLPPPSASGAQPLVNLDTQEDEDEDAYLSAIFADEESSRPAPRSVEVSARASDVAGADAQTHFDLGMAYREMGLVDAAVAEFEAACSDPAWRARALVMTGTLRVHRGETEAAVADLRRAVDAATTAEERCEANYELAVVFEKSGDTVAALAQLDAVDAGYRDRDARVQALRG